MLNARLLTFSVLLPCFCWLIFFSNQQLFFFITSGAMFFALLEWLKLLKTDNFLFKTIINIIFLIAYFLAVFISWNLINNLSLNFIYTIMNFAALCWSLIFVYIVFILFNYKSKDFNISSINHVDHYNDKNVITKPKSFSNIINCVLAHTYFFYGIFPGWLAINYLKVVNKYLLMLSSLIIIATDVGGYLIGKKFGKTRLIIVSPKKTWEGLLGGYVGSLLVCSGYYIIFNLTPYLSLYLNLSLNLNIDFRNNLNTKKILLLISVSSVTCIFAVIGDLFESLLKRIAQVKDSGNILPGHGGILDRADSFCSAMPIFLLMSRYFEL